VIVARKQDDLVEALFRALVNDGFTAYCCGPKDCPIAMISVYEWPTHLDVITMPQEGPAAAARLARPADALDPPGTAVWAREGDPESTIWALLNLPDPSHPDAPAGVVLTPEALRVPREHQRPMSIRVPDEDKVGFRATRLSPTGQAKKMSEKFFSDLFGLVDAGAAIGAASNFVENGTFQFASFPTITGRTAIVKFVMDMFTMVSTVEHWLDNYWEVGKQAAFTEGMVTFTRHDRTKLVVPFATVSHFTEDGQLTKHKVYTDASALVPASAPQPKPSMVS
jgi:hypothetical protein